MKLPGFYYEAPFKKNGSCKPPLFFAPNGKVFSKVKNGRSFINIPSITLKKGKQWHKGDAFKMFREQSGLIIDTFAEKVGVSVSTIRSLESGKTKETNQRMIRAFEIVKKVAEI
jgi:DNA-binding XRE family transcriptional regulator